MTYKTIYTGYFAKTKIYEQDGLQPVSIAGKTPGFFKGPKFPSLAPEYKMFSDWKKGKISDMEYTKIFTKRLNELDKEAIKRFINSFDKPVVLLCYEKPGDFCHRHIVADWIEGNLGIRVDEYFRLSCVRKDKAIEYMKNNYVSYNELKEKYKFTDTEVDEFINSLKEEPPEGYFLYYQQDIVNKGDEELYTLEDREEFLSNFNIGER